MTKVKLYRYDYESNIIDLGMCNQDCALNIFEQCCQMATIEYESGEEAIAETSFGLSKSDKDFIEISCHGEDSISVHTDRIYYKSTLSRFFSPKHHFHIQGKKSDGTELIKFFYQNDRETFEKKYANFLCR